jgi:hypothetical protein
VWNQVIEFKVIRRSAFAAWAVLLQPSNAASLGAEFSLMTVTTTAGAAIK